MTWQALITETAVQSLVRRGVVPSFRLVRTDLLALAAEVDPTAAMVQGDPQALAGILVLRVEVWCPAIGRCIRVDEWRKAERKRAYRTLDTGVVCIEGPDDENAEAFDVDRWQGEHCIAIVNGHKRAYALREVEPSPDPELPTLRWDPVTDRATLDRLGVR